MQNTINCHHSETAKPIDSRTVLLRCIEGVKLRIARTPKGWERFAAQKRLMNYENELKRLS